MYVRGALYCFYICKHCKMIITIKLVNTPITSHGYSVCVCVCVCECLVRALKIYTLSKFQDYNTVLIF